MGAYHGSFLLSAAGSSSAQEIGSARVVFEATGGYERALLKALFAAGLVAERLSANRPRELARALGLKAKTDAIDARVLAVAAQLLPASPSTPLPEKQHFCANGCRHAVPW